MKLLNKLRALKKDKKGFTLIEIVIVIVIIAILAAMLVPSMLSWIDKANQRSFLSACDSIKTSYLSVLTEAYATKPSDVTASGFSSASASGYEDKISDLVGAKINNNGTGDDNYTVTVTITSGNKLATMTVKSAKYSVTYSAASGGWSEVSANS